MKDTIDKLAREAILKIAKQSKLHVSFWSDEVWVTEDFDKIFGEFDRKRESHLLEELNRKINALASALGYTFEEVEAQPSKIVAVKKGK